jgi:hypothetical protein
VGGPSKIDYGYKLISKQLQLKSMAASQAVVDGQKKDHLWIQRSSGSSDWNATKLFNYGDGCLLTSDNVFHIHGWYTYAGGGTQPPPVDPPVDPPSAGGCTAPQPPIYWTAETLPDGWDTGLIGQTRYVMTCVPHGNVVDCTVQNQRACDYCAAIGMGEAGGQIRCGCPVRNECPDTFKCEERVACEAYLTTGTVLESRNGATCSFKNNNPYQFEPSNGNCRLCGANGTTYNGERQGCGAWF